MDSIIVNRAKALLDYLYAVIKVGQKIHTKIDEYGDFVLYMDKLPDHEGIELLNVSEDNAACINAIIKVSQKQVKR
ncbi:hypothetical protein [Mahella australiensis]|uniref:Uncharacterized protein n=1 Tax=Mahella australiensis (strain DSM 15567 / CIP 107919 / 50-1 BON) TaxID=697281 RepID=F4A0J6_MAHA5|nr:hypothetical protein [Mahella australiensis]AEE95875.1 hypothetical protein Mahau_0672 [Mahella australiensis 50-1 BON]